MIFTLHEHTAIGAVRLHDRSTVNEATLFHLNKRFIAYWDFQKYEEDKSAAVEQSKNT